VVNIDCVIICETPKVLPYREAIRNSLSAALEVPAQRIFLKGKTAEGLGPLGKGRAVEVLALCLLEKP
jgi:2-C-methyl-D-erythritol 2,4-cyclodiphosphate synthase